MTGGIALLSLLCLMLAACGGGQEASTSGSSAVPSGTTSGTSSPDVTSPGVTLGTTSLSTTNPGAFIPGAAAPVTASSGTTTLGATPGTTTLGTSTPVTTPVVPEVVKLANLTKTFGDGPFQFSPPLADGGAFTLISSNPLVAVISGNTVTIVGAGTATITGTQAASGGSSQTTTVTLVVNKAHPGLALPTVTVKALSSDGVPLRASSNSNGVIGYVLSNAVVSGGVNGTVATLSRSGTQTLIRTWYAGTATITATQVPTANYAGGTISAALVVEKASTVIDLNDLADLSTNRLSIPLSYSYPNDPLTGEQRAPSFSLGDPAIGNLYWDADLLEFDLLPYRGGTTTMTFSLPETTNLAAASKTATVTFTQVTAQQDGHQLAAVVSTNGSSNPDYLLDSATSTVTIKLCASASEQVLFRFTSGFNAGDWRVYLDGAGELPIGSNGYIATIPNVATGATPLRLRSIVGQVDGMISYPGKEFDYDVRVLLYQPNENPRCLSGGPV